MAFTFSFQSGAFKTFDRVKGPVCHLIVVGVPISDSLVVWCHKSMAKAKRSNDTVTSDPDVVTCRECKYTMQSAVSQREDLDRWSQPIPTDPYLAWLRSGDCGVSSKTIWSVLSGLPLGLYHREGTRGVPQDPSDFGRCYRLLERFPGWRERLGEVVARYPEWEGLVARWDELSALYEEEVEKDSAPKLYAAMKEILG